MARTSTRLGKRKLPPPPKRVLRPDWDWIEQQYRAGIRSNSEIARISTSENRKVSHVAIGKKAKRLGWTKDLGEEVQRSIRNRLAVTAVTDPNARADAIVEAAAQEGVSVVQSHRADIKAASDIGRMLRAQLDESTRNILELEQAAHEGAADEPEEKKRAARRAMLAKAIGLPVRASVYRDLMQAERIRIALERQAFNIDARHEGTTLEDYLRNVDGQ